MRLGFVCTNYNNSGFTRAALESLYRASAGHDVSAVVVDNGSQAADVEALRRMERELPRTRVVYSTDNIGYFAGLNLGIRTIRAMEPQTEHLVVGNNDLLFPDDFVDAFERRASILDVHAVVSPDIVTLEGVHQNPHILHPISTVRRAIWDLYYTTYPLALVIGTAARLTRRFTSRKENTVSHQAYRTAGPILQGYGACYLLGPKFFRHFHEFFAPTFMMHEEFFLQMQLESIGQRMYYDPRFVVQHHGHATTNLLQSRGKWTLARDAHRVMKQFIRLSTDAQRAWIARSNLSEGAR